MKTLTATEARTNLYRLIDQTAESHQPIAISGKRASAILISADDWESIQETLYLLSVPGMRESIAYFGLSGHLFRFHPARRFGVIRPA